MKYFTLDDYMIIDEKTAPSTKKLSIEDKSSIILLIILCITFIIFIDLLQGIPLELAFGALPFLLRNKLSYSELAIFSLTNYPYSLKLLWSPIVDSCYIKSIGRRKTWIVPIQLILCVVLWKLGHTVDLFLVGVILHF